MNSVKETLQIFLRSIPEGTLFNIVGFGTNTKSLFGQSREYNEQSLATAVAFVEKMFANLGGTNIIKPLMEIFSTAPKPGIPRQLFLMTGVPFAFDMLFFSPLHSFFFFHINSLDFRRR